ncbi:rhamnogalacturonan lyase [Sphingomonas sp. RS2018]
MAKTLAHGLLLATAIAATPAFAQQWTGERLDRGVVALPVSGEPGVLVTWRLLGTDTATTGFNVYRNGTKLNDAPLTGATNYVDATGSTSATYVVKVVTRGVEMDKAFTANVWADGFGVIALDKPAGGTVTSPDGTGTSSYTYSANDASVGDLDGDGKYEIVLKWDPSNSQDNSLAGLTGPVLIDAYTLAGKRLWRINLGTNIRAGAHYTQFQVFDYDGDGRAEVVMKTADGTTDGEGRVIGDANADWRNRTGTATTGASRVGFVLAGPEYLTVFQGTTGRALSTVNYVVGRHPDTPNPTNSQIQTVWGDNYGNRVDRFLAGTAFLDGTNKPSIIMARGYYTRSTLTAWDFRNGQLTQRWLFDSAALPNRTDYEEQGNHNLSIADVDGDGRDEIIYGSMAIDDNGQPLWTAKVAGQRLRHGDAMHLGDLDPTRPGLERFSVHESPGANGGIGASMVDARTGEVLWTLPSTADNGRGMSADIDPRYPGEENWSSRTVLSTAKGEPVPGGGKPNSTNFGIWWDGDTLREQLDNVSIRKWDWNSRTTATILTAADSISANGTKATPALSADILGDWREEVILASADSTKLRIFTSPYPTTYKLKTLMHDRVYRQGVAWQNTAYNQPPHTSFDLGTTAVDTGAR